MSKLKPCPFCGDVAMLYTAPKQNFYAVDCINCGASIESEDYDEVIELWNRRAEPEVKQGHWIRIAKADENGNVVDSCSECFHCDEHAEHTVVQYCWHCGAKMEREQDD